MLSEISLKLCVQAVLKFKPLFLECVLLLTFYILNIQVPIVHLPPSPPGYLSGAVGPRWAARRVCGRLGVVPHSGRVEGKGMAFAKWWWLQCASSGCCHVLHSHHRGFRAGPCEPPGEDTRSPAFGTSLLDPAGGIWQHPNWLPAGRDLRGSFISSKFPLL